MLSTMEKILFLKRQEMFEGMTSEQLRIISSICTEEDYLQSEIIFEEGDIGDRMYIVVSGEIEIYKEGKNNEKIHLANLDKDKIAGEFSTLTDQTRNASGRAASDLKVLTIEKEEFRQVIREYPELAFEIFKVLIKKMNNANAQIQAFITGKS
jgi:CRP/FNR family transcriptional regulator, cyclic AMP receptor protein